MVAQARTPGRQNGGGVVPLTSVRDQGTSNSDPLAQPPQTLHRFHYLESIEDLYLESIEHLLKREDEPWAFRLPMYQPGLHSLAMRLQGAIDLGTESFGSTTLGSEPDPAWEIAPHLGARLSALEVLAELIKILRKPKDEAAADDEGDIVVFGRPNRIVRVKGRRANIREGKPLIVAEDFED